MEASTPEICSIGPAVAPSCDGQTDRQTDTGQQLIRRAYSLAQLKNDGRYDLELHEQ